MAVNVLVGGQRLGNCRSGRPSKGRWPLLALRRALNKAHGGHSVEIEPDDTMEPDIDQHHGGHRRAATVGTIMKSLPNWKRWFGLPK